MQQNTQLGATAWEGESPLGPAQPERSATAPIPGSVELSCSSPESERAAIAESILLACAKQYYVASGIVILDGQDGYGPLRDARLFIEAYGSEASRAELAAMRNR